MIYSIEGIIGAGKSTLCAILRTHGISVVPEPLGEWVLAHPDGGKPVNVLTEFYKDPNQRAYLFQSFCLRTRVEQVRGLAPLANHIIERSIDADAIFGSIQYQEGRMDPTEYAVYRYNYQQAKKDTPCIQGRIYVKTSVGTAFERIQQRSRNGETAIDVAYLSKLETEHEAWLAKDPHVLVVDGEQDFFDEGVQARLLKQVHAFLIAPGEQTVG